MQTTAYAAMNQGAELKLFYFHLRELRAQDVLIDILYCGICHSDLHKVNNDWNTSIYPMVPGHEIIGRVRQIGSNVTHCDVGDVVGVGCMVDSCKVCDSCLHGEEQFCSEGATLTYNSQDKISGGITYGGYANKIVVDKHFVLLIDKQLNPAKAAPLLCAGITCYSPLKRAGIKAGKKVGIIGLGGLGHIAVKIANAMGAYVSVFTHTTDKLTDALRLKANEAIFSGDLNTLKAHNNSFDLILNTVSAKLDIKHYLNLLKRDAILVQLGLPNKPIEVPFFPLVKKRINLTGSLIGGIPETQEMLDFCAKNNISADIELIDIDKINHAYTRLKKGQVKYRFVLNMRSLDNSN